MSDQMEPGIKVAIGVVLLFIATAVLILFVPLVADKVAFAQASGNITGSSKTLVGLLPMLLVVSLVAFALTFIVSGVKGFQDRL